MLYVFLCEGFRCAVDPLNIPALLGLIHHALPGLAKVPVGECVSECSVEIEKMDKEAYITNPVKVEKRVAFMWTCSLSEMYSLYT